MCTNLRVIKLVRKKPGITEFTLATNTLKYHNLINYMCIGSSGVFFVRNLDVLLVLPTVKNGLDFIQCLTPGFGQTKIHKYSAHQAHRTVKEEHSMRTHLAHLE